MSLEEFQAYVDDIAARTGAATTLIHPNFDLVVFSRHAEVDEVRREGIMYRRTANPAIHDFFNRYLRQGGEAISTPARPGIGVDFRRLWIPLRWHGVVYGYFALFDCDADAVRDQLGWILGHAESAARRLYLDEVARRRDNAQLATLLGHDAEARDAAFDLLWETGKLRRDASYVVLSIQPRDPGHGAEAIGGWSFRPELGEDALTVTDGHGMLALLPAGPRVTDTAQAVVRAHGKLSALLVGIGSPVARPREAHRSARQAVLAAQVGQRVPELGDVVAWDGLGPWTALARLWRHGEAAETIDPRVRRLLGSEGPEQVDLVRRFIAPQADVSALARSLEVHRATVYGRIERLERAYGLRLADPEDRLAIEMGLRLARLYAEPGMSVGPPAP